MNGEFVHSLGTAVAPLLLAAWLVRWACAVRRERRARHRSAALLPPDRPPAAPRADVPGAVRAWLPSAGTVAAGWALAGDVTGVLAGAAVAAGLWWWQRKRPGAARAAVRGDAVAAARQLPLAADLVAACIAAGAGPVVAARAVGDALGGPVGDALARGAAEVRLGGEPSGAWRELAGIDGAAALARLLERADVSGLPAAGPVAHLAERTRADRARATTERARRAAVTVTAPVGLCFLPAFIAVGVLPVVIGLAGGVLGGGGG
ncbi:type II secretion system F family protein [Streptomyces griseoviridis]|uniref:Flp pilus assembly protein TadB n=3 Tax=Streptomyces TaxID=1883 RepID=A0ABT9LHP4_STRGD|nr:MULTISPECIES: type II secretion system F family protein [Streptomyces]MDP9683232.1 Flp pilus assembly protein TadB [Streptomyces griseoviridis]GGS56037.1 membrane protein [Streptomyces niveoruber]GGT12182.1 membrane protein [Streptomyces griseoviridis]GGU27715.1 membrane protein [Streptomyces daghestanicus]GHI31837.1 membrane protein [Streptomyces daghestanicus]